VLQELNKVIQSEIKCKQFEHVILQTRTGMLGQLILFVLMYSLLVNSEIPNFILNTVVVLGVLVQVKRYLSYKRYIKSDRKNVESWIRHYIIEIFANSLVWVAVFVLMFIYLPNDYHYIAMAVAVGLSGGAIVTLGAIFKVYFFFTSPIILSVIVSVLVETDDLKLIVALATILGWSYLLLSAKKHSDFYSELIEQNMMVRASNKDALALLGRAGEYRDEDTGFHVERVAKSSYFLAIAFGIGQQRSQLISDASRLHDIGKIGISDLILLKPGKLTEDELKIMKNHARLGYEVLDKSSSEVFSVAKVIALSHHERWDGTGYPDGLAKDDIPLEARMVSICDVYDALTSERPYKKAWPAEKARDFIHENSGSMFDPSLVKAFDKAYVEIKNLKEVYPEEVA